MFWSINQLDIIISQYYDWGLVFCFYFAARNLDFPSLQCHQAWLGNMMYHGLMYHFTQKTVKLGKKRLDIDV